MSLHNVVKLLTARNRKGARRGVLFGSPVRFSIHLPPCRRGGALVMSVVFVTIVSTVVAYVLVASNRQTRNTYRSRLFNTCLAASATVVKSMTQQAYFMATTRPAQMEGDFDKLDSIIEKIAPISVPGYLSAKHGQKDLSFFNPAPNNGDSETIDDPTDDWNGFNIRRWNYEAVAFLNAEHNGEVDPTAQRLGFQGAGFKASLEVNYIPLYQYAIFYDNDLEIHPGPEMEVLGPVHGNSTMWVATGDKSLTFHDKVSAAGNFRSERDFKKLAGAENKSVGGNLAVNAKGHDMDGYHEKPVYIAKKGTSDYPGINANLPLGADSNQNTFMDSRDNDWLENALDRWGGNLTDTAMGNKPIRPPLPFVGEGNERKQADPAELIQPIDWDNDTSEMRQTKMEGFADVRVSGDPRIMSNGEFTNLVIEPAIHDANGFVTGYGEPIPNQKLDKQGNPDGAPIITQGKFFDNRENKTVYTFDIDVSELARRDSELNISDGNGVVYASTDDNSNSTEMNAIRLIDADEIPTSRENTLTVATNRPMYLEGDVNTDNPGTLLLAADAITVTSQRLALNNQGKTPKQNAVGDTVTNAIFMLGQVSSKYREVDGNGNVIAGGKESDHYMPGYGRVSQSGGAHNVLRYLENWKNVTHTYNGSLICLFESRIANTKFGGSYYNPPDRDYNWDARLKSSAPPKGMPVLVEVKVSRLERISQAEAVALLPQ